MGLFDKLRKKPLVFPASVKGKVVPMAEIPDDVFSQGILGPCIGVDPAERQIHAPFDGEVLQLPDSCHALGLRGGGLEILLHIGVDTVEMKGDGFTALVKEGDRVKKGQPLIEMDLEKIAAAQHPAVVIHILMEADSFSSVTPPAAASVEVGDALLEIVK